MGGAVRTFIANDGGHEGRWYERSLLSPMVPNDWLRPRLGVYSLEERETPQLDVGGVSRCLFLSLLTRER